MPELDAFESRYKLLNAEQRQAVDTLDGPVMVIAGPGTGKTEVLTMRIANILRGGHAAPERILALTFTEAGATTMRRRLVELVGADAYRVEISTFHGFANRVIRDYPDQFPTIIGASSITDIEQVSVLRGLIDGLSGLKALRPFGDRYYHLRSILVAINELKQQGVAPERFVTIAAEAKEQFYANPDLINQSGKFEGKMKGKYISQANRVARNIELAEIYAEYQKALAAAKQYDYSDMIMYVALALESSAELQQMLQGTFDYFLVDEHQDTNDAQNKIIELIVGGNENPNLFIVGDEKQAIYRFQGASSENFHYFQERYKKVTLISLINNYRSTQAILDVAHGVSPRETPLVAKAAHAAAARAAQTAEAAHLVALSSPDVEYYFLAQKIKELVAGGTPAEKIAVLYRNNKDVTPIAQMFEKQKVPFNIESNQDVLGDEEIRKLIRLLRAVQHFGNDVWLAEALHVDFLGIPPIDVYRLSTYAFKERRKMYEVMQYPVGLEAAGVSDASKMAFGKLFEHLSAWRRAAKNKGAAEVFEAIVYESGFLVAILNHPSATEKLAKLHALFDILKSFVERRKNYTLEDFFSYLDLMEEHDIAIRGKDAMRLPGRVRLMTAHGSKGLEFEYVFIVDVSDRKWGAKVHRESIKLPAAVYRGLADEVSAAGTGNGEGDDVDAIDGGSAASDLADERNLFYVAITRAQKELFLVMAKNDRDGKEQLATQFVAALAPTVLAPLDATAYEADFAAHREEIEFAPAPARTPELKDKEFLNELFRAQGISVTALNNYLECPWAYFYRNLVRIPEAPNKNLSFGNAVHAALKSYFDALSDGVDRGKAYLVQRFEESLAHEPIKESEYEEALEKGRRALPIFYDTYHAGWSSHALNEARVDALPLEDGTLINGKLDRIEFLDGNHVRVIDYKTGKPKTRNDIEGNTASSDGNYKRQLVFYKLLLDKEGKRDMKDGVIQFIEPDDRGKMHREEFEITPGEVKVLEAQVVQVAREILDLSFWNKGCHEADCKYCELRKGMK